MSHPKSQPSNPWRRPLPSHLLWRSILGPPAAWSGSGVSRGVHLMDVGEADDPSNSNINDGGNENAKSMMRRITSDKRMFHLPCSLRDVVVTNNDRLCYHYLKNNKNEKEDANIPYHQNYMKLLSQPRIVSSLPSSSSISRTMAGGRAIAKSGNGISCMDLDRGIHGERICGGDDPSRYLLVGSGGGDCSISLYDLSYFGCDEYLYQQQQKHRHTSSSSYIHKTTKSNEKSSSSSMAAVTHRPIARSLRDSTTANNNYSRQHQHEEDVNAISGVPTGHRHPLLGVHWYPADVYGSFVSASKSGEILVWDAQNFIPVFATYSYVYGGGGRVGDYYGSGGGGMSGMSGITKSVSPLQCTDLPRTPEGCPHGQALLALGLGGGDGRGVIQLCDAFRGGSATHELIGHGNGGVNAIAWDPFHPFRIASGGDDHQVRLWDVRKSGASACLGVLDRESAADGVVLKPTSSKKYRCGQNAAISRMDGIESHGGAVIALAFTPGGEELVSAGLDGRLRVWDLRPDSSFVDVSAVTSAKGFLAGDGSRRTRMDPAVATGGRLAPAYFTGPHRDNLVPSGKADKSRKRPIQNPIPTTSSSINARRRNFKISLAITQPGSRSTTMLWLAGGTPGSASFSQPTSNNHQCAGSQITGYSLFGKYGKGPGGPPEVVLSGHLDDVTCLTPIVGQWDNLAMNRSGYVREDAHSQVMLLTGGKDGMVLSWGAPIIGGNNHDREDCDDEWQCGNNNRNPVLAMLQRQQRHRQRKQLTRFHEGNLRGNELFRRDSSSRFKNSTDIHDEDTW